MSYTNLAPEVIRNFIAICPDVHFYGGPSDPDGLTWKLMFPNGYGASIVKNSISKGHAEQLWELALIKESSLGCWRLFSDDVRGFLSERELMPLVCEISEL